jgi:hypothetical protein
MVWLIYLTLCSSIQLLIPIHGLTGTTDYLDAAFSAKAGWTASLLHVMLACSIQAAASFFLLGFVVLPFAMCEVYF